MTLTKTDQVMTGALVCCQMQNVDNIAMMEDDTETEEALAEFDFLVEEAENGAGEAQSHGDGPEWGNRFLSLPLPCSRTAPPVGPCPTL